MIKLSYYTNIDGDVLRDTWPPQIWNFAASKLQHLCGDMRCHESRTWRSFGKA